MKTQIVNNKRTVVLAFICLLLLTFNTLTVNAADSKQPVLPENEVAVSKDSITEIALNWAKYICPNVDIKVQDIVELYDYDNALCGFSVNLTDGSNPYGYVNIDLLSDNIISEFSIEKNAAWLTNEILSESNVNDNLQKGLSKHAKLYKRLPFEYSVALDNDSSDVMYDQALGKISEKRFQDEKGELQRSDKKKNIVLKKEGEDFSAQANKINNWDDILLKVIPSGLTNVDPINLLSDRASVSEEWAKDNVGKYACSVQAMYNIACQKKIKVDGGNVKTYNFLWDKSGTTETDKSKKDRAAKNSNIVYGSTTHSKIQTALVALAKNQGYAKSSCATSNSPTYATFKTAVKDGKSSVLSMNIVKKDNTKSGHSVSVVGYFSAKNKSGTIYKYLYVADGWYNGSYKYVCISNKDNFTNLYSTVLTIKK
jgi:hypothetical protein